MNKRILLFSFALVFLISCNPSKKLTDTGSAELMKPNKVWKSLEENKDNWNSYSSRISARYKDPYTSVSFTAKVRAQKDSALWVSISAALGIELVRAFITPDRVQVINKLERSFLDSDFTALSDQLGAPVTFETLQSVFTGTPIFDWKKNSFYSSVDSANYLFSNAPINDPSDEELTGFLELLLVSISDVQISEQRITELSTNRSLWIQTKAYTEVNGRSWPSSIYAEASDSTRATTVQMRANKVETDIILSFPFTIPEDYAPMR